MSFVTTVLAQTETPAPLIMPTWGFGVTFLVIFAALAFVIWSYRDIANRHAPKAHPFSADHAGAPGATHHGSGHPTEH
ncbi:MAG: hypothetical protein QOF36_677 [Microbacteriaceae bacterium]|jgi:hypothetical protein|nr:hypothetical protein [Microbacteriaceae bacterium]